MKMDAALAEERRLLPVCTHADHFAGPLQGGR
jgi:hypothetical protein